MKKKIGPVDISYCVTPCEQADCKRNLRYWDPPTTVCSMTSFDSDNPDTTHKNCEWKR